MELRNYSFVNCRAVAGVDSDFFLIMGGDIITIGAAGPRG